MKKSSKWARQNYTEQQGLTEYGPRKNAIQLCPYIFKNTVLYQFLFSNTQNSENAVIIIIISFKVGHTWPVPIQNFNF
jgi:hypothetical protein